LGRADHTSRHEWDAADGKAVDGWIQRKDGILEAIDFAKAHPVEASEIMAKYFEVDPQKYRAILEGVAFADLQRNREYFGTPKKPDRSFRSPSVCR
jgi:hypothetical protein